MSMPVIDLQRFTRLARCTLRQLRL